MSKEQNITLHLGAFGFTVLALLGYMVNAFYVTELASMLAPPLLFFGAFLLLFVSECGIEMPFFTKTNTEDKPETNSGKNPKKLWERILVIVMTIWIVTGHIKAFMFLADKYDWNMPFWLKIVVGILSLIIIAIIPILTGIKAGESYYKEHYGYKGE